MQVLMMLKSDVEVYNDRKYYISDMLEEIFEVMIEEKEKLIRKEDYNKLKEFFKGAERKFNLEEFYLAKNQPEKKIKLPLRLTFGITIALCGLFLFCLPEPTCKTVGWSAIWVGVGYAADSIVNTMEEKEKVKEYKQKIEDERRETGKNREKEYIPTYVPTYDEDGEANGWKRVNH